MPCTFSFVKYNLNLLCSFYFYLIKETGSFDPRTIILMPSFYFFLIRTFNFQITVAFCGNCMLFVLKNTSKISQIFLQSQHYTLWNYFSLGPSVQRKFIKGDMGFKCDVSLTLQWNVICDFKGKNSSFYTLHSLCGLGSADIAQTM